MKNWSYDNEQWTQLPGHLKHLPLFTRQFDLTSWFFRVLWGFTLKFIIFRFYVFLIVKGSYKEIWKKHPRLLVISNHASHIDAVSITASIPFRYWLDLYISAAKDYWFSNPLFTFFSKHCLGAIPIDRKDKKGEAIQLCTSLLTKLERIWLIIFPEGTRSPDGYVREFKRGVMLFSKRTNTPVLFLYIHGNSELFPKGAWLPKPGILTIHVGPVILPEQVDNINELYRDWATTINPNAYPPDMPVESTDEASDAETDSATAAEEREELN
jgi:1-acyl-sn-glycerol-3-phosphate acyltransferase